jgi:serine/threonine protein phosphatase PrpC
MAADQQLSIGELAARSGLSAKALRLYDTSDLLAPRRVDPFSGYRYYDASQIVRARLIARLRGIGMGLQQIRGVCDQAEDDPAGASRTVRAWWLQQQADARSRNAAVVRLLDDLRPTSQEDIMTTTVEHTDTVPARPSTVWRLARGAVRPTQQDAQLTGELPGSRTLLAVADGFGTDDELASRTLDLVAARLRDDLAQDEDPDVLTALERAWPEPADLDLRTADDGLALTLAVLDGDRLAVAHVGDARVLVVHDGHLEPVTRDHTFVASMVAEGRLSEAEAVSHPQRATLNRALAEGAPSAPDLLARRIAPADRVALMSDGVHMPITSEQIAEALGTDLPLEEAADLLVADVEAAGSPDNLAIVLAEMR